MGVSSLEASNVSFFMDVCRFQDTQGKAYIEYYISVDGTSVLYKKGADGQYQASVKVAITLQDLGSDAKSLIFSDALNLLSMPLKDTVKGDQRQAFMHQGRIQLRKGNYKLQVEVEDNYVEDDKPMIGMNEFYIEGGIPQFAMSDLEFISHFGPTLTENAHSKHGYDIIPFVTNGVYVDQNLLGVYLEVYNATSLLKEDYFLHATIRQGSQPLEKYSHIITKKPKAFDFFEAAFDISDLPSQTYTLQVDVLNSKNETVETLKKRFFVSNSRVASAVTPAYTGVDGVAEYDNAFRFEEEQLDYYIATLRYISTSDELVYAKALETFDEKKSYFYQFWANRRQSEQQPIQALWRPYWMKIKYANEHFKSSLRDGWETDRGRVFLTYGGPNNIDRAHNEPGKYPYEIWQYNRIGVQAGLTFVFYNPDLSTEEYVLLHSNKYGEVNNPRWRFEIVERSIRSSDFDETGKGDLRFNNMIGVDE